MSAAFAISTVIEFLVAGLLIFGFIHEEKVVAFEQAVKRIIIGNIKHYIRTQNRKRAVERGEHLRIVKKRKSTSASSSVVA